MPNFIPLILRNYPKSSIDNKVDLANIIDILYRDRKFDDWNIERTSIKKEVEENLPISIRDFILSICTIYRDINFPGSQVFGIKKGSYARHYKEIKDMFPESKFVELIRDGRAVFNSKKHSIYSGTDKPFETDPYKAAEAWCDRLRLLKEIKKSYEDKTLIMYYENMISNIEKTIESVCNFLDAPYNSDNISKTKKYIAPERYNYLHKNIEKDPLTSRISAWQKTLSRDEIFAFESIAYEYLLSEGYELVNSYETLKNVTIKGKKLSFSLQNCGDG